MLKEKNLKTKMFTRLKRPAQKYEPCARKKEPRERSINPLKYATRKTNLRDANLFSNAYVAARICAYWRGEIFQEF